MSSYRALYRKWRPTDFDEVCGQNAITDILKYEVEEGKLSHAYLFAGSRGTGKTSCAKILAKAVNCLSPRGGNPCNCCEACRSIDRGVATDVIEMDAASNNGVDNVRDLKDEITFTPAVLRYRVYIIDEVHMMSQAAFNALLKTLEEPPTYVIFILATTELYKLPTTIISRCQRFDFRRIGTEVIIDRLSHIAAQEGIALERDGARVIARLSQGGMRDAVSLLELCASSGRTVSAELVVSVAGGGSRDGSYRMIREIAAANYGGIYSIVHDISMSSADLSVYFGELIDAYRDLMVIKTCRDAQAYLDLTDQEYADLLELGGSFTMARLQYHASLLGDAFAEMQKGTVSKRSLAEITLTRMCDPRLEGSVESLTLRVEELEKQLSMLRMGAISIAESATRVADAPKKDEPPAPSPIVPEAQTAAKAAAAPGASATAPVPYRKWSQVVERIGELKRSLSVQFISATATVASEHRYTLYMGTFFAKRLASSEADLAIVRGVIGELEGVSPSEITVIVMDKDKGAAPSAASELDSMFS